MRIGRDKIDYLHDQKESRKVKNAPLKAYNWDDIVQRSKMMAISSSQKHRTYITHLQSTSKVGEDHGSVSKKNKKEHDNVPKAKAAVKNTDEIKNALISHCKALIKYVSRLRKYPYVC